MTNCFLSKLKTIGFISGLIIFNNCVCYPELVDIVEGTKNFIKQEIQRKHKTVELKTISIKIPNEQTIEPKMCGNKVNYYFPIYSTINQKATVIVECNDSWKIYVPVNIKFFAHVISAKKPLPKLHVISKEDLIDKQFNVLQLKDRYYVDPNEVVGLVLKNSVKQNTVLTSGLLEKG